MPRPPSLFVSHGAPTFALEPGLAGPALAAWAHGQPRPEAVLVVSPHWMTPAPRVGTVARPDTIHDFGGFDRALYDIQYPATGHPQLAQRAVDVLRAAGYNAQADGQRGLDHGAWVPLMHMYPHADVPVFQVSLPARLDAESAWQYGQALAPLANEGVLIVGSGSITHNLYDFQGGHGGNMAYAVEFAQWVRNTLASNDMPRLKQTMSLAPHAQRAHPTAEHYWPLLVAAGAAPAGGAPWLIDGGMAHGMLSMDAYAFGATNA